MKKKTKIINNADDYGYCSSINYGIIDAYQNGVLSSTTMMAGMDGFEHGVKLAKENPNLAIGVHCTLTCGRPILKSHKTIVDEGGRFKKLDFYNDENTTINDEEVYNEWKAQINKIISVGISPSHLDSHHHIHTFKNNREIIIKLAKEYNLPIRNSYNDAKIYRASGIKCNDTLIDPWSGNQEEIMKEKDITKEIIRAVKEKLQKNKGKDVIELMWHPAYMDRSIMENSSFNIPRIYELEAIRNKDLITFIENNFIVCTFKDI